MSKVQIKVEPVGKFFERARQFARRADAGKRMPESQVVAFEEAEDLLALLSQKRVQLLRALQQEPGSIADLARRLRRDRAAVTRDVQQLARFGVIEVTEKPLPGHGRQKWIRAASAAIDLVARV